MRALALSVNGGASLVAGSRQPAIVGAPPPNQRDKPRVRSADPMRFQ